MAESILALVGSRPEDDRATVGALLVARGLDDLATCAEFARAYAAAMSRRT